MVPLPLVRTLLLILFLLSFSPAPPTHAAAADPEPQRAPGVLSKKSKDAPTLVQPRDRLGEAVHVHDLSTVLGLIKAHNDGVLLAGIPPIHPDRRDHMGRTALHVSRLRRLPFRRSSPLPFPS